MTAKVFGSGIRRREDPRLITGTATYTDDIVLPGMVHAAILRSPHAHARIKRIDTAHARAAAGVLAVYTGADTEVALKPMPCLWLPPNSDLKVAAYPLCPLCLREWEFLRVVCPQCGEQQFSALPVYTAEQFAHVRIEACDRCRRYLKTIDLTKDGLAVPLVDDFASLPLDLWAREQGYVRLRANLLGL